MLPFLMCCHRGKSESVYHLSCPPGYVSIELEHDLDDDVFEQSYFGYEYEMFKSFPKASKPAKKHLLRYYLHYQPSMASLWWLGSL